MQLGAPTLPEEWVLLETRRCCKGLGMLIFLQLSPQVRACDDKFLGSIIEGSLEICGCLLILHACYSDLYVAPAYYFQLFHKRTENTFHYTK